MKKSFINSSIDLGVVTNFSMACILSAEHKAEAFLSLLSINNLKSKSSL